MDEYCNILQQPSSLIIQPDEIFLFSREGCDDDTESGIYLIRHSPGNEQLIRLDAKDFVKIFLIHFESMNTDFFIVPYIDDVFS